MAKIGYKHPPEFGRQISKRMMGHTVSDETRKKISKIHKGTERPKILISEDDLRHNFVELGKSVRDCAAIFECSVDVIWKRLHKYNINNPNSIRYAPTKEWLIENYVTKQLTMEECAKLLGCNATTVLYHLKKHCIPRRGNGYKLKSIPKEWLIENYIEKGLSSFECGRLWGCDYQIILKALNHHNLLPHNPVKKSKERMRELINSGEWDLHGDGNPNWRGGKAFFPYCPKFNEDFKEHIRNKFGRKCFLCGAGEAKKKLPVHHIDYNKNSICNGRNWAFVPMCYSCHSHSNGRRYYYFNLLIYYWLANPAINFNAPVIFDDSFRR